MSEVNLLINTGMLEMNKSQHNSPEKTVVVLGVARGGTTMVASVLEALGVPMGEKLGPVKEDVELSQAIESGDIYRFNQLINTRNSTYPIWGWKRPAAVEHSEIWEASLRNPYIIAIFRDPFAIANRNRISMLSDVFKNMENSISHLDMLVQFLQKQRHPTLLCSYEKAITAPEAFVQAVDNFLQLDAQNRWEYALHQINPESREYLESSRITQSQGELETVNQKFCSGWAFYPNIPSRHAKVDLLLNGTLVETVMANRLRGDIKEGGVHPTGICGFKYEWPMDMRPKMGDQVSARVSGDNISLPGSPKPVRVVRNRLQATEDANLQTVLNTGALPSFYAIGALEAGTAWLYEMLKKHPQIKLPENGETHYWDIHIDRPFQWYRNQFIPGFTNGDMTPTYATFPEVRIKEIYQLTPNANILFSMRNPVERAWLHVQVEIKRKFGGLPDDILTGNPTKETLEFIRQKLFQPSSLVQSNYARTIQRWTRHFNTKSFMCFRYERIIDEPRGLLKEICNQIQVDPNWIDGLKQEMLVSKLDDPWEIKFPEALKAEYTDRCKPFLDELEQLLGQSFENWRSG